MRGVTKQKNRIGVASLTDVTSRPRRRVTSSLQLISEGSVTPIMMLDRHGTKGRGDVRKEEVAPGGII